MTTSTIATMPTRTETTTMKQAPQAFAKAMIDLDGYGSLLKGAFRRDAK